MKDSKGRDSGKTGKPKHSNKGKIVNSMQKRGDIKNPEALAAYLGRKKMGKANFQKKASQANKSQN